MTNKDFGPEIARVLPSELVFIVGSGVSHALPSGLPTGNHLRIRLLDDLLSLSRNVLSPSEADQLNRAVKGSSISNGTGQHEVVYGIPFEGVLDIYNQIFPASGSIIKFLKYNLAGAEPTFFGKGTGQSILGGAGYE